MTRPEISVEADWAGQPWTASDRENWREDWTREGSVGKDTSDRPKTPTAESESIQVESANKSTSTQEDSQADTAVQEANTNTIQPSEMEEVTVTPADYSWITEVSDDDDEKHSIEDFQIGKAVDMTGTPEDFGFTQEQMDESNNSISLSDSWKKAQEYADEFRNPISKFADNFVGNMKDQQMYNFLNKNGVNVSLTDASKIQTATAALGNKLSLEGALSYDDYSKLKKDAILAGGNDLSAGLRILANTGEIVNEAAATRTAAALEALAEGNVEAAKNLLDPNKVKLSENLKAFVSNSANKMLVNYLVGETIAGALNVAISAVGPRAIQALVNSDSKIAQAITRALSKTKTVKEANKYSELRDIFEAEKGLSDIPEAMEDMAAVTADSVASYNRAYSQDAANTMARNLQSIFSSDKEKAAENMVDWARDSTNLESALANGALAAEDVVKAFTQVKISDEAKKAVVDNLKTVAPKLAASVAAGLGVKEAAARPTGYATPEGKSLDSKDIVKEFQKTPYEGDDAVTIQSREGEVTLPAKQAVLVAEAEGLSKSDGYTDEVKDLASETTLSNTNRDQGQLGYDVETSRPTSTPAEIVTEDTTELTTDEKSGIQQSVDIVQALLGGRDLDNDGTITAQEQFQVYKDTVSNAVEKILGPIANAGKSIASTVGKVVDAVTPSFIDDLGMLKYLSPKQYLQYEVNKTGLAMYDAASNVATVIAHPVVAIKDAAGNIVDWTEKQFDDFKSSLASNIVNLMPNWSDTIGTDTKKTIVASVMSIAKTAYAPALAVRAGANYISSTVREIAHLQGYDMTEDEVRKINLAACNLLGLVSMPVGTLIRDAGTLTVEKYARSRTETVLEFGSNPIIPVSETIATTDVRDPSKPNSGTVETTYGTETGAVEDADAAYSGAVANAKNSNLATDYNYGMEQETNEAVSDGRVKEYIISIYKKEPDYIKNAIGKVLKSFKEV